VENATLFGFNKTSQFFVRANQTSSKKNNDGTNPSLAATAKTLGTY
jgi:hypothetical protein